MQKNSICKYAPYSSSRYKNKDAKSGQVDIVTKQSLPELYENRENCCGCSACYSICSAEAITMESDEEGFLYPVVDSDRCIRCYKCLSICVFKEDQKTYLK